MATEKEMEEEIIRLEVENSKLKFIIKMLEEQIKIMREFWEE